MKKWMKTAMIGFVLLIVAFGWILADAVTRPQSVHLKSQIRICKQSANGSWEQIDEAGPAQLNFSASLSDLASAKKANTDFVWRAKTKKGLDYVVRLASPADLSYNPANGQIDGNFVYEISYDGKTARVHGRLTTESAGSPLGNLQGKRATAILGVQPSDFTFVSTNEFQAPGEAPLKLVSVEEYRLTPGK
jgi:hypothetical protein